MLLLQHTTVLFAKINLVADTSLVTIIMVWHYKSAGTPENLNKVTYGGIHKPSYLFN